MGIISLDKLCSSIGSNTYLTFAMGYKLLFLIVWISRNLSPKNMATNEELEKRIETLEKEVQHLKAFLQYQMRNKKKWFILIA